MSPDVAQRERRLALARARLVVLQRRLVARDQGARR